MSMFVVTDGLVAENRPAKLPTPPPSIVPASGAYESAKVALEFVFAALLLLFTAPLILFAVILIKLTSRGPAFYTQTRIGKDGKPFTIYKLRTMMHQCESLTGAQWCLPGDTRVTRVGRWLRKTHIDELPQLWNVLRGDMSLIGPRPERPEFMPVLEAAIPHYRDRLRVRPGVSGFAQVQLPPDTDLDSVRIKLAYDLHYVQHVSLLFDLVIYLATLGKLLGVPAHVLRVLCRLPKRDVVAQAYQKLVLP
jgi:lipopolysaccharide/colanic/teichoic acid biosynthesis glycosyltransferase